MTATVKEIIDALEVAYPPALAEEWDTAIGLTCGDPADAVASVLFAVDLDAAVLAQAESIGAQLIVTHHPLLFVPVQSVAADTPKGALVHRMIRAGIAHFAAHTNADKAVGGVNDALAALLGLDQVRPLVADGANVLPPGHVQSGRTGTGRIGQLRGRLSLTELTERVAAVLPFTVGGVRAAGDPARIVSTVALCGGAGGAELDAASAAGADVYVTSDLRHHAVSEHLGNASAPAVVEIAHWAGEWPWLAVAAQVVTGAVATRGLAGSVNVTVSEVRTDPWTIRRPTANHPSAPGG